MSNCLKSSPSFLISFPSTSKLLTSPFSPSLCVYSSIALLLLYTKAKLAIFFKSTFSLLFDGSTTFRFLFSFCTPLFEKPYTVSPTISKSSAVYLSSAALELIFNPKSKANTKTKEKIIFFLFIRTSY